MLMLTRNGCIFTELQSICVATLLVVCCGVLCKYLCRSCKCPSLLMLYIKYEAIVTLLCVVLLLIYYSVESLGGKYTSI